jgi:enoyl-CoA hydratase/carnithine racemase
MKRPRLVGAPAALDLPLTGRRSCAPCGKLGIADECVPPRIMEARRAACRLRCHRRARYRSCATLAESVRGPSPRRRKQVANARRGHYRRR